MSEILVILDSLLGSGRRFARDEFYYYCPLCHHHKPKLAVNLAKRKWQCWKCGARGATLLSLLRRLDVSKEQIARLRDLLSEEVSRFKTDFATGILTLPAEYKPLFVPSSTLEYKHALAYLYSRGLTDIDVWRYQIGYCAYGRFQNRVIIPSFDNTHLLNFFVGRDYYGTNPLNYMIPSVTRNIIGFESQINWKHPIILVEGVFDAMAVKRNAIPLFGKTLSKKLQERIIQEGVSEVYLALDKDALKETLRIAERFMNNGIAVFVVELSGKDPSKLGFDVMQHLIRNAEPLTFRHLMQLKVSLVQI